MLAELEFFAVCNGRWIKENSLAEAEAEEEEEEEEEICLTFSIGTTLCSTVTSKHNIYTSLLRNHYT
jgi:hypothetical protein